MNNTYFLSGNTETVTDERYKAMIRDVLSPELEEPGLVNSWFQQGGARRGRVTFRFGDLACCWPNQVTRLNRPSLLFLGLLEVMDLRQQALENP